MNYCRSKKRKHKKQGKGEEKTEAQDVDAIQHGKSLYSLFIYLFI